MEVSITSLSANSSRCGQDVMFKALKATTPLDLTIRYCLPALNEIPRIQLGSNWNTATLLY